MHWDEELYPEPDPPAGVLDDRQHSYRRAPVKVTVTKKSQASRAPAWERRKLAQVVEVRSGAGSIPACCSIPQTVEAETSIPRTSSLPWMRR